MNPGFRMSFSAVVALSLAFSSPWSARMPGRLRWVAPAAGLLLSSLVAGMVTAPYAGASFNRFAAYGLLANMLAVPAMGLLVMPGAVILALGALVGITQPALLVVELGCRWILLVAEAVAGQDGASWGVRTPSGSVLPLLTYGGLLLVLWQGRFGWSGLPLVALAAWIWAGTERPSLLIASSGAVMGVQGEDGRAISHEKGDGYEVAAWLENDSDTAEQATAAGRPGLLVGQRQARTSISGTEVLLVRGKQALATLGGCDGALVLVTNVEEAGPRPCLVLDATALSKTGAVAGWETNSGLRLITAAELAGNRPWTRLGRRDQPPELSVPVH